MITAAVLTVSDSVTEGNRTFIIQKMERNRIAKVKIVTTAVRTPNAAAKLISLLNKYSSRERTSTSTGSSQ